MALTDREHAHDTINGHTDDTFALILPTRTARSDDLHADVDGGLLAKPHDLRACTPVPAHKRFVRARRDQVLRRERNGTNAIQVSRKLLQRREGKRREQVHPAKRIVSAPRTDKAVTGGLPDIMEADDEDLCWVEMKSKIRT